MPSTDCYKIAFIGSHGVGKTTLCFGLAARLKTRDLSLEVVHEVARRCPLPINTETTFEAQAWIAHTQVAEELLAQARYPLVICDRSIVDNYAYLQLAYGPDPALDALVDAWIQTYDQLFLVPVVNAPQADGMRAIDPKFQNAVEDRVRADMHSRNVAFNDLSSINRDEWLDAVEAIVVEGLRPPQLDLL
jgi:nicotinamide riboside kinase